LCVSAKNVTLLVFDKEIKKRKEDNLVYANLYKNHKKNFKKNLINVNFMLIYVKS